jgi:hypothetical protein
VRNLESKNEYQESRHQVLLGKLEEEKNSQQQKEEKYALLFDKFAECRRQIQSKDEHYALLLDKFEECRNQIKAKEEQIMILVEKVEKSKKADTEGNLEELSRDFNVQDQKTLRNLALKLKDKDEEISAEHLLLREKMEKCKECEARLDAWQKELEGVATALSVRENELLSRPSF